MCIWSLDDPDPDGQFLMYAHRPFPFRCQQDARNPKLNGALDIRCRATHNTFLSTVAANMFLGAELLALLLPGAPPRPPLRATLGAPQSPSGALTRQLWRVWCLHWGHQYVQCGC